MNVALLRDRGVAEKQSTSQKSKIPEDAKLDWYIVKPQLSSFLMSYPLASQ